ncbi:MAG: hypothetical protein MN733_20315 [Nitrososphaera sp.]|nr:hypothetical protein [Nitrososphaera sp.]
MIVIAALAFFFGISVLIGMRYPSIPSIVPWTNGMTLGDVLENPPTWLKPLAQILTVVGFTIGAKGDPMAIAIMLIWGARDPEQFAWLGDWNFFNKGYSLVPWSGFLLGLVGIAYMFKVSPLSIVLAGVFVAWFIAFSGFARITPRGKKVAGKTERSPSV